MLSLKKVRFSYNKFLNNLPNFNSFSFNQSGWQFGVVGGWQLASDCDGEREVKVTNGMQVARTEVDSLEPR